MLADVGTAALIVLVVLVATLLPMYAKWRAMQALVDRFARRSRPLTGRDPFPHPDDEFPARRRRVKDSSNGGD
jgi:hypothetical protein